MSEENKNFDESKFKPIGAMAFFVALIALFVVLWFVIYFVAISRIQ